MVYQEKIYHSCYCMIIPLVERYIIIRNRQQHVFAVNVRYPADERLLSKFQGLLSFLVKTERGKQSLPDVDLVGCIEV